MSIFKIMRDCYACKNTACFLDLLLRYLAKPILHMICSLPNLLSWVSLPSNVAMSWQDDMQLVKMMKYDLPFCV